MSATEAETWDWDEERFEKMRSVEREFTPTRHTKRINRHTYRSIRKKKMLGRRPDLCIRRRKRRHD